MPEQIHNFWLTEFPNIISYLIVQHGGIDSCSLMALPHNTAHFV